MTKIVCEVCKPVFECNSNDINNCWCKSYPPKKIELDLKNCICATCLSKMENQN